MIALVAALMLSLQADAEAAESWRESNSGHRAVLSFGEAANALIRLSCARPGVIRADLSGLYTGEGPEPRRVVVESGRVRGSYPLFFNDAFSAEMPVTAPVMRAFGRSARLRFAAANVELTGDATQSSESRTVSAFLARCRN